MKTDTHLPSKLRDQEKTDKDGNRLRAVCVGVRDQDEAEVLLVSCRQCPNKWSFPGGGIRKTEDERMAALRELNEEAGVSGKILRSCGTFFDQERKQKTSVFVLVINNEHEVWEEQETLGMWADGRVTQAAVAGRRRGWFSVSEAKKVLKESQMNYFDCLNTAST